MDGGELAAKPVPPAGEIIRAPAPKLPSTFCFSVCGQSWANTHQREWDERYSKSQIRQRIEPNVCVTEWT